MKRIENLSRVFQKQKQRKTWKDWDWFKLYYCLLVVEKSLENCLCFIFQRCVDAHALSGGFRKMSLFSKSPSRKADEISSEFIFQLLLAAATIKNLKLSQLNLGKSVWNFHKCSSKLQGTNPALTIFPSFFYYHCYFFVIIQWQVTAC